MWWYFDETFRNMLQRAFLKQTFYQKNFNHHKLNIKLTLAPMKNSCLLLPDNNFSKYLHLFITSSLAAARTFSCSERVTKEDLHMTFVYLSHEVIVLKIWIQDRIINAVKFLWYYRGRPLTPPTTPLTLPQSSCFLFFKRCKLFRCRPGKSRLQQALQCWEQTL